MNTNSQLGALEVIRLADLTQSISVRLRSTEPALETPEGRYYDADVIVTSGFVNGMVYLGFSSGDLTDLGLLLDAIEEAEQEADLDEPFTADWPQEGRTAYLRFIADDPYVIEVHDGTGTQIVVAMPLDMGAAWIAESRQRLAAAQAALSTGTEDHDEVRP